jgi:hypothetical protein
MSPNSMMYPIIAITPTATATRLPIALVITHDGESGDPTARNLMISVVSRRGVLGFLHGGIRSKCPQHRAGL